MKKLLSVVLAVLLLFMTTTGFAAGASYSDVSGHWAEKEINKWSDKAIIQGYDGKFRPDDPITRGEFAVIIDRIMGYRKGAENSFTDLGSDFYTSAILKAVRYGVMNGYPDKTVQPTTNISRQEAMVMIFRAFQMSKVTDYQVAAKDADDISDFAKDAMTALVSKGFITGRGDGMLCPKDTITRAEVIKILDNMISDFYTEAGTYTTNASGYVVINATDVHLQNITINGSLFVTPGVAEGDVTLRNVTVKGDIIVLGGGVNSIKILGSSVVSGNLFIQKIDGEVRIVTDEGVEVPYTVVEDGSNDIILEGSFNNVTVSANAGVKVAENTNIKSIAVNSEATVSVSKGASVDDMTLNSKANVSVSENASVSKMTVNSEASVSVDKGSKVSDMTVNGNATVNVSENASVSKMTVNSAANVTVSNNASVSDMSVNAAANVSVSDNASVSDMTVNGNATIDLSKDSNVGNMTLTAPAQVKGEGTVASATITEGASGVKFDKPPETTKVDEGTKVTIGDIEYQGEEGQLVEIGETTPPTNPPEPPPPPAVVTAESVTLYLSNNTAGLTSSVVSGVSTFSLSNLSAYPDSTAITGIKINTNVNSTYTVQNYSIPTNEKQDMSVFLGMLGLNSSKTVTLGLVRGIANSCSVNGIIGGGGSLAVTFHVGTTGYYSMINDGTNVFATLEHNANVSELAAHFAGYDPVKALVGNVTDTAAAFTLRVDSGSLTLERTMTYAEVQSLTLQGIINMLNIGGYTITSLSQLVGKTVTLTYGSKVLTLYFT